MADIITGDRPSFASTTDSPARRLRAALQDNGLGPAVAVTPAVGGTAAAAPLAGAIVDTTTDQTHAGRRKLSTVAEILFGSVSGIAGKLVEYPFDTVKVRLQTQPLTPLPGEGPSFRGPLDCFLRTVRAEGFAGLYKGISAPVVGAMIENSGLFFAYHQVQSIVRGISADGAVAAKGGKGGGADERPLTIAELCACG
ncbi:hypothetical protein HK101_001454, partial [Irineochytrium annulatum]